MIQILCPPKSLICLVFLSPGWEASVVTFLPAHALHFWNAEAWNGRGSFLFLSYLVPWPVLIYLLIPQILTEFLLSADDMTLVQVETVPYTKLVV